MTAPRRLKDSPEALPPQLARALSGAPGEPSTQQLQLLAGRLSAALGAASPGPARTPLRMIKTAPKLTSGAVLASAGSLAAKPLASLGAWVLGGLVLGVGLSAVASVAVRVSGDPTVGERAPASSASVASQPRSDTMGTASAAVPAPSVEPASPPELVRPQFAEAPAAPKPATTEAVPSDARETELSLLRSAHQALTTDPNRALSLSLLHAQRFTQGALAQEREVIAIDALLRLGRVVEARARAARFRAQYPGSVHLQHLDALLEKPEQPK